MHEKHQFHESLELLNAMRRVGGVRRIARSCELGGVQNGADNGAPMGQISERVMRHVDFESLNQHIQHDTEFKTPQKTHWGAFESRGANSPMPEDRRRHEYGKTHGDFVMPSATEARTAAAKVHQPTRIRTLQEELFG